MNRATAVLTGLATLVRSHRALLLVGAMYLAGVMLIVPPTGDFPTCDDWDYSETAIELARTGRMELGYWPAMTLVTHVAWGAGFVRLFGESWTVLRASTMAMAWIGGLSIYALARQFRRSSFEAALCCGAYVGAPIVLAESYTFKTDVTGTGLMLLMLAALPRVLQRNTPLAFCCLGIFVGAGFMARQTAALPAIALTPLLLWNGRVREFVTLALSSWLVPAACYGWLYLINGLPTGFGRMDYDLDVWLSPKGAAAKLISLLLEVALLMSPVVCLTATLRSRRAAAARTWSPAVFALLWAVFVVSFAAELRPYRGWDIYDCGLGFPPTPTIEGASAELGTSSLVAGVSSFHAVTLSVAAVAALCFAGQFYRDMLIRRSSAGSCSAALAETRVVVIICVIAYAALLMSIRYTFDRYVIPLVGLALVLAAAVDRPPSSTRRRCTAATCLSALFACSLIGVQDWRTMHVAYWDLVREMHADGIPLREIDFGAIRLQRLVTPLNGFSDRDVQTVPAERPSGQSVGRDNDSRPTWRIAFRPSSGWSVVRKVPCSSWMRTSHLLVLHRDEPERAP